MQIEIHAGGPTPAEIDDRVPRVALVTLRRCLALGQTRIGLGLLLLVVLIALVGPFFAPYTHSELVAAPFAKPSSTVLLGTDYLGHDVLSRLLWGGRSVLWMSLGAAALGVVAGTIVGLVAGYSRGYLDALLMRTMDLLLAFPTIVLVLLFISLIGTKLWLIVALIAVVWMPQVARVARGTTLEITQLDFIKASHAIGIPRRRILMREILPNIITPLMVEFGLRLTWSIALIAAISFLGFGIQPPSADWGLMVNENRNGLTLSPWGVVAPVLCIAVLTIGANLITEGVAQVVAGTDREGAAA
jgi:peptide/nickel transport system permease protein